jgi:glycosyltransferase involved in cell wall biosynthesis
MKIAIFGTRGIPNHHGGFEQFTEWFAPYLADQGHEVYVYCSHNHPYQEKEFGGAKLQHCYDPEFKLGTAGQFIYDLNCLLDARKRDFDILLQLGYTSSSVWYPLLPKKTLIATNMDGLEWKRSKYPLLVRRFLAKAEAWAVKSSDYLISDNRAIEAYLKDKYAAASTYIPYGAEVFENPNAAALTPSLLEAMGSQVFIVAHDNPFNKAILGNDALYFSNADQVRQILDQEQEPMRTQEMIRANTEKIRTKYSWDKINAAYLAFLKSIYAQKP